MEPITGPFAQILEANRSRFNARFAEARRFRPKLDAAAFGALLRTTVAPIVEAVSRERPDQVAEAGEVLYDVALDLLGQELLGPNSRYPFIVDGWNVLLPRLARFIAEAPHPFIGSVTNALYNLSLTPGARTHEWAASLLTLAETCPDAAALLKAGQVAAWRAGMAHYRPGALEICRRLPPAVALAALGLPPDSDLPVGAILDQLTADPWLAPTAIPNSQFTRRNLRIVARVGAFRGFGGLFLAPPTVAAAEGHILVSDGKNRWLLFADLFGATFHRTELQPQKQKLSGEAFQADVTGAVWKDGQKQVFPELANLTSVASTPTTLAVTTPLSYAVYLVAFASEER